MKNVLRDNSTGSRVAAARTDVHAANIPTDEIDLLAHARTLAQYWYVLALAGICAAGATYAVSKRIPPTYQVTFKLMVTEPRFDNAPAEVRVATFRELVESPTQAASLLREFGLDGPPHNLTAQQFLAQHVDVQAIRDTAIISVTVRLKDRDLLPKFASRYAEQLVGAAHRLSADNVDYTIHRIGEEREAALRRLNALEAAVQDYRRRAQLEVLQRDVDDMLARRADALDLSVEIQGQRARLAQAEAELARQQPVRQARRAIDAFPAAPPASPNPGPRPVASEQPPRLEPAPQTSASAAEKPASPDAAIRPPAAGRRSEPEEAPSEMQIRSELLDPYVNPVYEALQRDVTAARTRLAGLEHERRELVSRLQLDAPSALKLSRLYEAEAALAALTRDRDVAREAYLNAANKFEDARLQSTIRSQRLLVLDSPLPPDRPITPRPARNAATAMLIGLTLAAVGLLLFAASRRASAA